MSVGGAGNECPCGGTHIQRTGQIKSLTITRVRVQQADLAWECVSGVTRVCVCVLRLLLQIKVKKGKTKVSYTAEPSL